MGVVAVRALLIVILSLSVQICHCTTNKTSTNVENDHQFLYDSKETSYLKTEKAGLRQNYQQEPTALPTTEEPPTTVSMIADNHRPSTKEINQSLPNSTTRFILSTTASTNTTTPKLFVTTSEYTDELRDPTTETTIQSLPNSTARFILSTTASTNTTTPKLFVTTSEYTDELRDPTTETTIQSLPNSTTKFILSTTASPNTTTPKLFVTTSEYTNEPTDPTTETTTLAHTHHPRRPTTCPEQRIQNLTFPETQVGSWATSEEICLNHNYVPVRIFCNINGRWKIRGRIKCSSDRIEEHTQKLHTALQESDPIKALTVANDIASANPADIKAVDVHFISTILSRATDGENISEQFVGLVDNIMNFDKSTLNSSQELLNSTDTILYSLDTFLLNQEDVNLTTSKLFIRTISTKGRIIGAMVIGSGENFKSFELKYLYRDNYEETLRKTDFEIGFTVPRPDQYYITLFYNDNLFSGSNRNKSVGSWIISILPPITDSDISIYFKAFGNGPEQSCDHWKYGKEDNLPIKGRWSMDGNAEKLKDGFFVCRVNHTTHFGMLFGSTIDTLVLDLINIFGSVLSIIGISVIFVTAALFKNWRNKANSKIILNVSFCLLVVIILFIISDRVGRGPWCIAIGILLHYMILVQFCWSLMICYSSYRRLYMISHNHISRVVLKFCIFSWGVPLVIVAITAILHVQTYDKKLQDKVSPQICYPKDSSLIYGVCVPVGIILTINSIVFVLIIRNLAGTKLSIRKHVSKRSFSIPKSIILLFFMLGITWIFGFLAAFMDNIVFLYIFCTMSSCHGFVIFIFYILDSEEVTKLWSETFKQFKRQTTRSEETTLETTAT